MVVTPQKPSALADGIVTSHVFFGIIHYLCKQPCPRCGKRFDEGIEIKLDSDVEKYRKYIPEGWVVPGEKDEQRGK